MTTLPAVAQADLRAVLAMRTGQEITDTAEILVEAGTDNWDDEFVHLSTRGAFFAYEQRLPPYRRGMDAEDPIGTFLTDLYEVRRARVVVDLVETSLPRVSVVWPSLEHAAAYLVATGLTGKVRVEDAVTSA